MHISAARRHIAGLSLLLLVLLPGVPPAAPDLITGSAHDFSAAGWNPTGEICVTCHTPHDAGATGDAPLWNHALTAVTSYTPYGSGTLDGTVGQPSGVSLLCLSCHDGTVALDNFGGTTSGSTFIGSVNAAAELGSDLSGNHPVSFTYDTALASADGELADPSVALWNGGPDTVATAVLEGGTTLQCSSCHDVHNTQTPSGVSALLRLDNSGSSLCLQCHRK